MNLFDLSDGDYVLCKDLSLSEFKKISQTQNLRRIDVYKSVRDLDIFEMKSKYITAFRGNYILFDSKEDVEKVIKDGYFEKASGTEVMYNKNPYNNDFPAHAEQLIEDLLKTLGIKSEQLDRTLLEQVQALVTKNEKPYHFYRENFIHFIALIGEYVRASNAEITWHMQLGSDGVTWNPYLKNGSKKYPFFGEVYEQIFNENDINNVLVDVADATESILSY